MGGAAIRTRISTRRSRPGPRARWGVPLALVVVVAAAAVPVVASAGTSGQYVQTNLISDIPGVARITDPNLVNPWGQAASPTSPLWVADNGTNVSSLYTGGVKGSVPSLVVSIPEGAPTGVVFNPTGDFVVRTEAGSAPANFIFDSEAGRITAWSKLVSGTKASITFTSKDAVYKGLALASVGGAHYLYASNFHEGRVDVLNAHFKKVGLPGGFKDADLPAGFAPFDIQLLGGELYVTYAKQDAAKHDDVAAPGNGFVDVSDTTGHLLRRLISHGDLNSPWGLALAPSSFGAFAGDLLVGNFGDGAIHAYDPVTGAAKGRLTNTDGNPILIDGLWALRFGNGTFATDGTLVFTAGIGGESHGLLGEITPAG
jgi:uncharacterized protein (TIGR03118 family)